MAISKQNKLIIGIISFLVLAFLIRKYWMRSPQEKEDSNKNNNSGQNPVTTNNNSNKNPVTITINPKQDTVTQMGGDAKDTDPINTKYSIIKKYSAMNIGTYKDYAFDIGTVVYKKEDRNGTMMNGQPAVKVVWGDPSGITNFKQYTYVIPTTLLKKI